MDFKAIILLIISALLATFGVLVYLRGERKLSNRIFSLLIINVAFWSLSVAMFYQSKNLDIALFWANAAHVLGSLIPAVSLFFTFVFPTQEAPLGYKPLVIFLPNIILFWLFSFTKVMIEDVAVVNGVKKMVYSDGYLLWILHFFIAFAWCFTRLARMYRYYKGIIKTRLKYIFVGTMVSFVLSSLTNVIIPLFGQFELLWLGPVSSIFWFICIVYAVAKYHLMDIRIVISRTILIVGVYIPILIIPFIITYLNRYSLEGCLGDQFWIVPTILEGLFAIAGFILYLYMQKATESIILSKQHYYQKILLRASSQLFRQRNLDKLLKLIVYVVKRVIGIKFAAMFLDDKDWKVYRLRAIRHSVDRQSRDIVFLYEHPFISYLKLKKTPIFIEELPLSIRRSINSALHVGLVIPLYIDDNLLGFVFLGEKNNRQPYSEEDISIFRIISHQTALAIENCSFFEDFKKYQEKIYNAEKLASIGGMAEGVAHQIRNRLNHFSVAAGELKFEIDFLKETNFKLLADNHELAKSLQYIQDTAESIISNVKRTSEVINGVLSYARIGEKDTLWGYFSVKEVIELLSNLLLVKHQVAQLPIEVDYDSIEVVYGIKAQILEVMLNIIDNAYEALKDKMNYHLREEEKSKFTPRIIVKFSQNKKSYLITIADNGVGIKNEDKQKIFAPFFTTKSSFKADSGIGMYVVKRMIEENHKGKVKFESDYMKGTTFFIELPKEKMSKNLTEPLESINSL